MDFNYGGISLAVGQDQVKTNTLRYFYVCKYDIMAMSVHKLNIMSNGRAHVDAIGHLEAPAPAALVSFIKDTLLLLFLFRLQFSHSPLSHLAFIYGVFNLNTVPFAFYRCRNCSSWYSVLFISQFCQWCQSQLRLHLKSVHLQ